MSRLDRIFGWVLVVFIYITVVLPSGALKGINFKYPIYACLLPLAVRTMFRLRLAIPSRVFMMLGVPCLFAIWVIVGIAYGFSAAASVRHYSGIITAMLICWLAFIYAADEDSGRLRFLRLLLNASVVTALFKIVLIVYALALGIPTVELVASISEVFGVNLMTMDLGALFGRVQFFSDALIPVSIFIVLRYRNRLEVGYFRAGLSILLLITSVVFSFSRYLWGFTAVAFLLGLALGRRDRFQWVSAGVLAIAVLSSLPSLTTLFELRFSDEVAGGSDQIRVEQSAALTDFFQTAPLFGHGFGSYSTRLVREEDGDATMNFSYEEQLLALCGQIGLVGMTMIFLLGLYYYSDLWWKSRLNMADRAGVAVLILCWLAAGLYNPLLLSPVAGLNYAAFSMLAGLGVEGEEFREQTLGNLPGVLDVKSDQA